ncbi:MAG: hypothetical protein Q4F95_07065 [Oscillospiraceae bacterium]|nr:hypothetical protein [Oscillospiraceae bacterium]
MKYYPFSDKPGMLVFTCCHVLENQKSITIVTHHFDDNNWQFLCNKAHTDADAVITTIGELCELDPSVEELCDLPVGHFASRKNVNAKWIIARIPDEKSYQHCSD